MMESVLMDTFRHYVLAFSLLLPRMAAIFTILPIFSSLFTGLVRNAVVASFVLIVFPLVEPTIPPGSLSALQIGGIVLKETLIGLLTGFLVSIPFWIGEGIGYFIDNQRGATMGNVIDPMSGSQTSLYGSLLLQVCAVLFFTGGGILVLLGGVFQSYQLWPVVSFYPQISPHFADYFLAQTDTMMRFIVIYAAPIVIALFVSEFGLGLINRFAPQLNVFFLAMPVKSGVASFLIILYISLLVVLLKDQMHGLSPIFPFLNNLLGGGGM